MIICKFCNTTMMSEYETNKHKSNRYKGYHTCPKCGALYDEDVTKKGSYITVHSEKWIEGNTKYKSGDENDG